MSGYSWLGVLVSAAGTTLALAGWIVMALPYLDNAPLLTDLRQHVGRAFLLGVGLFGLFFGIFFLGARYLDETTSGGLMAFAALIIALPVSMLLGPETWERYSPKAMDRAPGPTAIAVATGIGLAELVGGASIVMLLL